MVARNISGALSGGATMQLVIKVVHGREKPEGNNLISQRQTTGAERQNFREANQDFKNLPCATLKSISNEI